MLWTGLREPPGAGVFGWSRSHFFVRLQLLLVLLLHFKTCYFGEPKVILTLFVFWIFMYFIGTVFKSKGLKNYSTVTDVVKSNNYWKLLLSKNNMFLRRSRSRSRGAGNVKNGWLRKSWLWSRNRLARIFNAAPEPIFFGQSRERWAALKNIGRSIILHTKLYCFYRRISCLSYYYRFNVRLVEQLGNPERTVLCSWSRPFWLELGPEPWKKRRLKLQLWPVCKF